MTDAHLRLLRLAARQMQRKLDDHDGIDHAGDVASAARRDRLERAAKRSRARVVDAMARRQYRERGQVS